MWSFRRAKLLCIFVGPTGVLRCCISAPRFITSQLPFFSLFKNGSLFCISAHSAGTSQIPIIFVCDASIMSKNVFWQNRVIENDCLIFTWNLCSGVFKFSIPRNLIYLQIFAHYGVHKKIWSCNEFGVMTPSSSQKSGSRGGASQNFQNASDWGNVCKLKIWELPYILVSCSRKCQKIL
jgi:hypothetical protein